ncbi:hypothetical protein, partial [Enterobacter hormaechei]
LSWLEHITHNDGVTGSNPVVATIFFAVVRKLDAEPDYGFGAARFGISRHATRTIPSKPFHEWVNYSNKNITIPTTQYILK